MTIQDIVPGFAADLSRLLQKRDIVVAVGDKTLGDSGVEDTHALMVGEEGSTCILTILRGGSDGRREVTLSVELHRCLPSLRDRQVQQQETFSATDASSSLAGHGAAEGFPLRPGSECWCNGEVHAQRPLTTRSTDTPTTSAPAPQHADKGTSCHRTTVLADVPARDARVALTLQALAQESALAQRAGMELFYSIHRSREWCDQMVSKCAAERRQAADAVDRAQKAQWRSSAVIVERFLKRKRERSLIRTALRSWHQSALTPCRQREPGPLGASEQLAGVKVDETGL